MRNAKLLLFHHGAPLANVPVGNVTPDMIEAALKNLWARAPGQGRRCLKMWERVLDFARAKGMRSGDNAASWKGMHEYRFARQRANDRGHHAALPHEQIPEFMRALRVKQSLSSAAMALEFVILTASRSGEVLGMTWSEIDWDKKLWVIPGNRMKAGKEHQVPLSDRVVAILELQQRYSPESAYVFTGYRRTRLADRCLVSVLYSMKMKYTVHGFRSTFCDWCGDKTNFQREHVEACLAHRVGNSVELAYRRLTALEKRREILAAWSAFCG